MASKFTCLILFISTFLLVQNTLGKPLPSDEGSSENTSDIKDTPFGQFVHYVFDTFGAVSDSTLTRGVKLLKDVRDEMTALDNKDEQMTARLEEYSKFIAKAEDHLKNSDNKDFSDKYNMIIKFGSLLDESNKIVNAGATDIDELFRESLIKNGLKDLKDEHLKKFEKFATGFVEEANKILSGEDFPQKQKLQEFVNKLEADTEVQDKMTTLSDFLDIFD